MKIAIIGHKRVPSREGGVEVVVDELSTRMAAMGHSVHLYNRLEDYSPKNLKQLSREYKGTTIHQIPTLKPSAVNAFLYSALATVSALPAHYDVIHFHAEGPSAMVFLPEFFHIPTVVTIHGLDWRRAKWSGFATSYLRFGEKMAAKHATEMIVLSRNMQDYFQDTYGRRTDYMSNGIRILPWKEPSIITEQFGLKKDGYLLYVGRIVPEKGIHYLIDAYREIDTDKRLVIAGKIDKSDYCKRICGMAAQDKRVLMTDFVQGDMLTELFSNTFLYVLPSDIEGMALSLLEAMSYGVRCLVSNISENTEAARAFADYFEKGNVADLREKIRAILKEGVRSRSEEQVQFIRQNHSWDSVVKETLKIYELAISKKKL